MISNMDEHTKHSFVDEGYRLLTSANTEKLSDLNKDMFKVAKNFLGIDQRTRNMFLKIFKDLAMDKIIRESVIDNVVTYVKNKNFKNKNN